MTMQENFLDDWDHETMKVGGESNTGDGSTPVYHIVPLK